jgi:CHAT domain-containing protein/tetratricopeptide (TPR) repeat protein
MNGRALADVLRTDPDASPPRAARNVLIEALDDLARHLEDHPGRTVGAIRRLEEMAAVSNELDVVARAMYARARATAASGEFGAALTLIRRSAEALRACSLAGAALRTNLGLAHILNETGRHADALSACDVILHALATDPPPDLDREARLQLRAAAEQNRGLCYELTGDWAKALEAYAHAEAGYARLRSSSSIGEVLNNRGQVLLALGRIAEAQGAFRDAIEMFGEDDRPSRALALNGLAEALLARGQYVASLAALADARSLLDEVDAPLPELDRTLTAARAYEALNLHREALASYEDAAAAFRKAGLSVEAARATWGAARLHLAMGDPAHAADALGGVIDTFREAGHGAWLALALLDRAATSRARGALAEAVDDAQTAASVSRVAGAPVELLRADIAVAELLQDSGQERAASAALDEAAEILHEVDVAPLSFLVAQAQGLQLLRQGRLADAHEPLERAARIAESLHSLVDGAEVGQRFMLDKLQVFDALVEHAANSLSIEPERRGLAVLAATERARRQRVGLLGDLRGVADPRPPADDVLSGELDAIYAEMVRPGHIERERFELLGRRVGELELRLSRDGLDKVQLQAAQTVAEPTPSIGSPVETILSWYCLRDGLIALVVANGNIAYRQLSAPRADVEDAIARLDAQWQHLHADERLLATHQPRFERACRAVLGELHDMLVAPVADLLPDTPAAPLVVVTHGPLQQIPVHALHDGSGYLIERFTMSTTPSVTDFVSRSARQHDGRGPSLVLAASDPTTPAIAAEGRAVAGHLGRVVLRLGADATAAALLDAGPGAPIVHIACHALFRNDNPMFSSLLLADRAVRASQLLDVDLSNSLVTLSACDSARSHAPRGEELVGLMRGVLGAGARTLVASLWQADDEATYNVMDEFYNRLGEDGPAVAMRAAQLAQLARTAHPYYWAPFVVIGGR